MGACWAIPKPVILITFQPCTVRYYRASMWSREDSSWHHRRVYRQKVLSRSLYFVVSSLPPSLTCLITSTASRSCNGNNNLCNGPMLRIARLPSSPPTRRRRSVSRRRNDADLTPVCFSLPEIVVLSFLRIQWSPTRTIDRTIPRK